MKNWVKMTKNKYYRQFLDTGVIEVINEDGLIKVLNSLKSRFKNEARALLITLYYTGARPTEVMELKAKDIYKTKSFIAVSLVGKKRGLPRVIYLQYKLPLVKELYLYSNSFFEDYVLFNHFKNKYVRTVKTKKGNFKEITTDTDRLRYHFKKWFSILFENGINPYYLRHNRFSKLAMAGASDRELRTLKGAKTSESINFYVHMSKEAGIKTARINK